VETWLKRHYRDLGRDVPLFEVNESSVEELYEFVMEVTTAKKIAENQIENLSQIETEMKAEGV